MAVPLAYFLTRAEKVQRSDGSKVKVIVLDSWQAEFLELWRVSARTEVRFQIFSTLCKSSSSNIGLDSAVTARFLGGLLQSVQQE